MAGFDNDNAYFAGIDTRGVKPVVNQMTTNGQLLIGSTAAPNIRVGSLASADGTLTITTGAGTIDLSGSSFTRIPSAVIDGKVSAFTTLITVARDFFPMFVVIQPTTITGLVSAPAYTVGFNNPTYDNVVSGTNISGALPVGNIEQDTPDAPALIIPSGSTVKVGIAVTAVATVYDFKLFLVGFYG